MARQAQSQAPAASFLASKAVATDDVAAGGDRKVNLLLLARHPLKTLQSLQESISSGFCISSSWTKILHSQKQCEFKRRR